MGAVCEVLEFARRLPLEGTVRGRDAEGWFALVPDSGEHACAPTSVRDGARLNAVRCEAASSCGSVQKVRKITAELFPRLLAPLFLHSLPDVGY